MINSDFTQRFVFDDLDARGCFVRLEQTLEEIQATHHYPAALKAMLNKFSLAAVLLRDSIKIDASVTLQLRSSGAVKLIMADCTSDKRVRAIAEYELEELASDESLDLANLNQGATLAITITPDEGDRYQSIVPIESTSLEGCLEDYFSRSEQLPTWFSFNTDGQIAVGIAIHSLPVEKVSDPTLTIDHFNRLKLFLDTLTKQEVLDLDSESILTRLFHDDSCRVFDTHKVVFGCDCSIEKSIEAIYSLGEDDVENLISEQREEGNESLVVDCHFCFQRYEFDFDDLAGLFKADEQA